MKGWFRWRLWLWLTAIIPALFIIIWPGHSIANLLAILWVALLGLMDVKAHQKQHKQQMASTIRSTHKQWITVMNHHRHDWMNDLQVLFGYVKLGKQERVAEYVERIKVKMLAESSVSKLQEPHLVSYLLGFRSLPSSIKLDISFEYEHDRESIHIEDQQLGELIIDILSVYRLYASKAGEDQLLKLTFTKKSNDLHIQFLYHGSIMNESLWKEKIEQQLNGNSSAQIIGALRPDQLDLQITKV